MGQITLTLKDETIVSLRKDFDAFLRVSLKLDPQFATPSFEDFLRAKLLDNMVPLTEHAVQRMLAGGQYAWAKRTLDKEFPDVVAILMRQAVEYGFGFAVRSEWTPEELAKQARGRAQGIVGTAADHGVPASAEAGDFCRRAVRRVRAARQLAAQFLHTAADPRATADTLIFRTARGRRKTRAVTPRRYSHIFL